MRVEGSALAGAARRGAPGTDFVRQYEALWYPLELPEERGNQASKLGMTSLRVLLVDDSGEILEVTRLILEMKGFDVGIARDAAEARLMVRHHRFDATVIDYGLGRENGAFLARELKESHPGLKVVLTSGMDVIPPEQMAMADAYYMKGDFSATDLADILYRLAGRADDRKAG